MLNIVDKRVEERIPAYLRLGFRPFFLLGSVYAVIAVVAWVWMFQQGQPNVLRVPALWWHVHEMLFGFAMAIVVGFLLTAVQNWTGIPGTKSRRLALLVTLWLLVRVLFWTPVPLWLTSSIEALFLALTAYEIGMRVVKAKGWRNLFFVPLFALAMVANLGQLCHHQRHAAVSFLCGVAGDVVVVHVAVVSNGRAGDSVFHRAPFSV
ncbi:NnrS family protein [Vibrio furnissii]|uniref:NnrS family protein n=1 Tax=Vibrio furnissii TaxID=29494 RepID=UPI001EEB48CA|nr:NnrS family protein [Vibrio furnissii]